MVTVSLNEEIYARFKAFKINDAEIAFLLAVGTNKIQSFKMDADLFEVDCRIEDLNENKIVKAHNWKKGSKKQVIEE